MQLPKTTTKQQDILKLLYRYRFVDRIQIQVLMGHKDKRRIGAWLKDLREKHYIEWIYSTDFAEKTKPAIYYLGINGIRLLRTLDIYPPEELRKRYRESSRQPDFIARCLLIAGCGVNLEAKTTGNMRYSFVTAADYTDPDNDYYFLTELQPHLCFMKQSLRAKASYLVEVFDPTTPRYKVKKRLKDYVIYLTSGDWERATQDDEPPVVLIACPTIDDLAYAKRRTRKLLENEGEASQLRFATTEQVKREGVTGIIWEDV
jgi:hypothetical protein